MKHLMRGLAIILVLVACLGVSMPVLAADPPGTTNVGVGVVTGGDANVGIGISAGGNVNVAINGDKLASQRDIQGLANHMTGSSGDAETYDKTRLSYNWIMNKGEPLTNLLSNGLAKVISMIGQPVLHSTIGETLAEQSSEMEYWSTKIIKQKDELKTLKAELEAEQERLTTWSGEIVQYLETAEKAASKKNDTLRAEYEAYRNYAEGQAEWQNREIQVLQYNQMILFYALIGLGVIATTALVVLFVKLRKRA